MKHLAEQACFLLLPPIIERFLTAPKESAEARDIFNMVAKKMGDENFMGVGLNNYSIMGSTRYAEAFDAVDAGGLAHHIYWLHYAELGILGPVLLALLMLSFVYMPARILRKRSDNLPTIFAIGTMTGFSIAMLIGLLEWNFRQTPIMLTYFMFAGFTFALPRLERQRKAGKRQA